jgi:hypothetical protein
MSYVIPSLDVAVVTTSDSDLPLAAPFYSLTFITRH